jgi:mycothiol system anti-sigma-R factor
MNCQEVIELVDGYLDGELGAVTNQAIERHLRDCAECQRAYEAHDSLVRTIGSTATYEKAPAGLRQRIRSSLAKENRPARAPDSYQDVERARVGNDSDQRSTLFGSQWNWLALAALLMVVAIVGFNFVSGRRAGSDQFLASQLIASHVRSLMANHLTDVASSDQHTVKPWLDTKLDFAPAVPDLGSEGFPLVGGRLDYLDNRPVAALVYQRRKHFINLFVWPKDSREGQPPEIISRQGYQLLHWIDSDFNYWAVSDVNGNDLQSFKQVFEKQLPPR